MSFAVLVANGQFQLQDGTLRMDVSPTHPATGAIHSLSIDEGIVKSASQGVTMGVGVRVLSGERTGYAYSDDLSPEKIKHAARVAACRALIAPLRDTWFQAAGIATSPGTGVA